MYSMTSRKADRTLHRGDRLIDAKGERFIVMSGDDERLWLRPEHTPEDYPDWAWITYDDLDDPKQHWTHLPREEVRFHAQSTKRL